MNEKKWVQHISGQGEKWEVWKEVDLFWNVYQKLIGGPTLYFPKSEYRPCDPPEEWEDVTEECEGESVTNDRVRIMHNGENILRQAQEHRIRKVQVNFPAVGHAPTGTPARCGWAFIIERRKSC